MTRTIVFLLTAVLIQSAPPKAGPWKSLFDRKSLNAWRIFKTDTAPKMCDAPGAKDCWEIANGVLRDGHANDIASKEQFGKIHASQAAFRGVGSGAPPAAPL